MCHPPSIWDAIRIHLSSAARSILCRKMQTRGKTNQSSCSRLLLSSLHETLGWRQRRGSFPVSSACSSAPGSATSSTGAHSWVPWAWQQPPLKAKSRSGSPASPYVATSPSFTKSPDSASPKSPWSYLLLPPQLPSPRPRPHQLAPGHLQKPPKCRVTGYSMDEPWGYNTKRNKPVTKRKAMRSYSRR